MDFHTVVCGKRDILYFIQKRSLADAEYRKEDVFSVGWRQVWGDFP